MTYYQPDPVILVDSSGAPYTASGGGGGTDMTATNTKLDTLITAAQGATPAGTNSIGLVGAASATVTGSAAALNAVIDGSLDLGAYSRVSVQTVSSSFVGGVQYQVSDDGVNWLAKALNQPTGPSGGSSTTGTALASGQIGARYFRVFATSYTSGSLAVTIHYSTGADGSPSTILNAGSSLAGGVNIGTGSTPSAFSTTAAASTNATSVKTSAGSLFEISVTNPTASPVFFKLYNKASAPTVGTDTPVLIIPIASGGYAIEPFGANGKRFTTGIAWALTGAIASADSTAVAAGVLVHGTYA
jgi:hypothetical protein